MFQLKATLLPTTEVDKKPRLGVKCNDLLGGIVPQIALIPSLAD
jgi:hypothetical protein